MRGPLLLLTWIVATVAATGLAWAGVRSVVGGVAAPLPAPAVTEAPAQLPEQPDDDPSPAPADVPTMSSTPRPQVSTPAGRETTVLTFRLVGGTATVGFSPTEVEVLSAVPAPGFNADVDANGDTTRVEFESADHRSRLDAWWDDRPRHEVEEHDRHDDDHDGGDD